MKVEIDYDTTFPVFYIVPESLERDGMPKYDIPWSQLEWVNRVLEDYEKMQDYLKDCYKRANENK